MQIKKLNFIIVLCLGLLYPLAAMADNVDTEFEDFLAENDVVVNKPKSNKVQAIVEVDNKKICVIDDKIVPECKLNEVSDGK